MKLESMTLAEMLGLDAKDLAEDLGMSLKQARQLAREKVYQEELASPKPGDELLDAFEWGRAVGAWHERYDIIQIGRLIAMLQRRLGRQFVRF